MTKRSAINNNRQPKSNHKKGIPKVRKPQSNLQPQTKFPEFIRQNHRYLTRHRKHCISCPADDVVETQKLYPKIVLHRCLVPAQPKRTHEVNNQVHINLNPIIRLRRCNFMQFINNPRKKDLPKLTLLMPRITLHRCEVRQVLDRRVVEASKFEMFMVELYPMFIRIWVNPSDFVPQKFMFDDFQKRTEVSMQRLAIASILPTKILAKRTSPNGEVHVLWM